MWSREVWAKVSMHSDKVENWLSKMEMTFFSVIHLSSHSLAIFLLIAWHVSHQWIPEIIQGPHLRFRGL